MRKIRHLLVCITLISCMPIVTNASEVLEKSYLIQMINQLEAMKPLVLAAKKEQLPNLRLQFHYTAYYDADGRKHNGLLDDINEIEQGIKEKLSQNSIEPHRFAPIKGDYG